MNFTHAHLYLNHLVIIGSVILFLITLYAVLRKRNSQVKMLLWYFLLVALITLPVYFTGSPAEDTVMKLPGMTEDIIERHEQTALISLIIIEVLGVFALIGIILYRRKESVPAFFKIVLVIIALVNVFLIGWTANLGGEIRHTEIRSGSAETNTVEPDKD